jgi:hypothetical protein
MSRYGNIDFKSILTKISEIKPLPVVVAYKADYNEKNNILNLNGFNTT